MIDSFWQTLQLLTNSQVHISNDVEHHQSSNLHKSVKQWILCGVEMKYGRLSKAFGN